MPPDQTLSNAGAAGAFVLETHEELNGSRVTLWPGRAATAARLGKPSVSSLANGRRNEQASAALPKRVSI